MRLLAGVVLVLVLIHGVEAAEQPQYINDGAVRRGIEAQGRSLAEAGQTVDNATLQKQVAERRTYAAQPPVSFEPVGEGDDLYETVDDGVLVIARLYLCGNCDKLHANPASGFVISSDGLAVTNYHVMANDDEKTRSFVAMTRDGKVYPVAEVLASNKDADVALIRLDGKAFTPLPVAESAKVGQAVHVVSHPSGRFYEYGRGWLGRFHVNPRNPKAKRVSVTCVYGGGSSGGPIVNDQGQVVAMVSEARVVKDGKIVFYDSVPYESIRALFGSGDTDNDRTAPATTDEQDEHADEEKGDD